MLGQGNESVISTSSTTRTGIPNLSENEAAIAALKARLLQRLDSADGGQARNSTENSHVSLATTEKKASGSAATDDASAASQDNNSSQAQRRSKLDLGAGRRMVFASLGLRNPKSKAEEDELRASLTRNVRPHVNSRVADEEDGEDQSTYMSENGPSVQDDDDSWRDKISYSGVECCQEGVELEEPPFRSFSDGIHSNVALGRMPMLVASESSGTIRGRTTMADSIPKGPGSMTESTSTRALIIRSMTRTSF